MGHLTRLAWGKAEEEVSPVEPIYTPSDNT